MRSYHATFLMDYSIKRFNPMCEGDSEKVFNYAKVITRAIQKAWHGL